MRLAQMLGVDYMLVTSVVSVDRDSRRVNRPDLRIDRTMIEHTVRVSYKVLRASDAGAETGGTLEVDERTQVDNNGGMVEDRPGVIDDLFAKASVQLAASLGRKIAAGEVGAAEVAAATAFAVSVELDVLAEIAAGYTNEQIADRLFISRGTVKRHAANIYLKLGAHHRTEAVARGRDLGLVD